MGNDRGSKAVATSDEGPPKGRTETHGPQQWGESLAPSVAHVSDVDGAESHGREQQLHESAVATTREAENEISAENEVGVDREYNSGYTSSHEDRDFDSRRIVHCGRGCGTAARGEP